MNWRQGKRTRRGVMAVLVAGLSLATVFLGFFAGEIWYANLALSHLQNCCDSASITAASVMVSSKLSDARKSRQQAKDMALDLMRKGSVLGHALSDIEVVDDLAPDAKPDPGQALVAVDFVDEHNVESTEGKHIRVRSAFCVPAFSKQLLGFGSYVVRAEGRSAAAKLDLAFCLDNSLSMATDSPVFLVRRQWNNDTNRIDYVTLAGGVAKTISGCGFGVPEPMYINAKPKTYAFNADLRGPSGDVGTRPGNYGQPAYVIDPSCYTDRIIDVSDEFSQLPVAIEAARGNLDNEDVFASSGAKDTFQQLGISVTPDSDYKKRYEKNALSKVAPFNAAKTEVKDFFKMMESNTDSHFCLIPFSVSAARTDDEQAEAWKVGSPYPPGGKGKYPFAKVSFSHDNSKYANVTAAIDTYRLYGGTAIPSALKEALLSVTDKVRTRSDARKAILLFTDGEPTESVDGDDPVTSSYKAAAECGAKGIPIYAVGFLHGGDDSRAAETLKGIVDRGGVGGRMFVVKNVEGLHEVFRLIARELVTLE